MNFTLPIYWTKTFKTKPDKTVLANLNWFRNAYYFDQNKFKQEFTELIANQAKLPVSSISTFETHYKLYYKSKVCDPSNIVALTEKVSLDAFQKIGLIVDDNVQYHVKSSWEVVEQDKDNPRCEIEIKEVE